MVKNEFGFLKKLAKVICAFFVVFSMNSCAMLFNKKELDIQIDSYPSGADVIINGRSYGRTPTILRLEPKPYEVNLIKEGHGSAKLNLKTMAKVREGDDGRRCLADAVSVIFFFDIFTSYCADFESNFYNVNIPASNSFMRGPNSFAPGNQYQQQQNNQYQQNYYNNYQNSYPQYQKGQNNGY